MRFWGHKRAKVLTWALTALGAIAMAAPRAVGWANGDDGQRTYWFIGLGALAILVGSGLKELDQAMVKRGQNKQLERIGHVLGELIAVVARAVTDRTSSVDRRNDVVAAAQRCTLRLLPSKSDGLRVCIYQLEYDEERQARGATPGKRPIEQAHLVLVGEPQGRGLDPARHEFNYDEQGRHTLDKILANKHVWCPDAKRKPTPGLELDRSYKCYLSVPIRVNGQVEGMLTCDAKSRGDLSEKMGPVLRMTAIVAGIGLRQDKISDDPTKPGQPRASVVPKMPQLD